MGRRQGIANRTAKKTEAKEKNQPAGNAGEKSASKGMRKVREIKAIDVEPNVWCHAPNDQGRKGKRSFRKTAERQNCGRMRKCPGHECQVELVHLLRDNLENERSNEKRVRILARLGELLLNQLDERIVDPA